MSAKVHKSLQKNVIGIGMFRLRLEIPSLAERSGPIQPYTGIDLFARASSTVMHAVLSSYVVDAAIERLRVTSQGVWPPLILMLQSCKF